MKKSKISIDLHLHFDGSLSLSNARALAEIEKIRLPQDDRELLKLLTVNPGCANLGEYLEKFNLPLRLLQNRESIEQGMFTLCEELKAENCIYAEIRFAPQLHLKKGLTQREVVKAAINGFNRSGMRGGLILCCMRGDKSDKGGKNEELNDETLRVAKEFFGNGVAALDLAGNESSFPTENFRPLFAKAKEMGIPFTIHAGEADCAKSVRCAVEMGAVRIGHGVRSAEDPELMNLLAQREITLELCPTSNLQTAVFHDISEYPIRKFLDAGVPITVNSDNRSVSATDAQRETELLKNAFNLTKDEVMSLLRTSVKAAFTSEDVKEELYGIIEDFFDKMGKTVNSQINCYG